MSADRYITDEIVSLAADYSADEKAASAVAAVERVRALDGAE